MTYYPPMKYQGFPKYQTPAYRADRALFNRVGEERYNEIRQERVDYYRDLIRRAKAGEK